MLFYHICVELSIDVAFLLCICYNRFKEGGVRMKKYNLIYAKNTFFMCFLISLLVAVPFLVVSFFFDAVENDILYSLYCLLAGVAVWLLLLLRIPFAYMILRRQEKMLGIKFDDRSVKPLYPSAVAMSANSLIYMSDEWLIFAGTSAFCRNYIEKFTVKSKKRKNHIHYYHLCIIFGKDQKKYYKLLDSASTAKRVREWYGNNG